MRHMIRSLPTETHIRPRTMNVIPPNILFCSTRGMWARAASTRPVSASAGGMRFAARTLPREGRGVEVDVERADLAIADPEDLGDVAREAGAAGGLEVVSGEGAGLVSVDQQVPDLERSDHRVEALRRLEVGLPARDPL